MNNLNTEFISDIFPFKIINNTSRNDICPSFYFKKESTYYILWIEHQNKELREDPESLRYTLSIGMNEGCEEYPEIYQDPNLKDLISSDEIFEIISYISN